jgi:hypothetical protein
VPVDIGFVRGGLTNGINTDGLVSLGSIGYEPLLVFYRSITPVELLSQLAGKRLEIRVNEPTDRNRLAMLWRIRREIVTKLATATPDQRRQLDAALRGIDQPWRVVIQNQASR